LDGPDALLPPLLRAFFADYVRLVEPDAAGHLLLDRAGFLPETPGLALAAEVPAVDSEPVTVAVLVEPEDSGPVETGRRIAAALRALGVRYGEPVLPGVVRLRGGRPGPGLESAVMAGLHGIEMARVFYATLGLAEGHAETFLARSEPLAWALAARMRPGPGGAAELRRACLARISGLAGLPAARRSQLAGCVEAWIPATELPFHPYTGKLGAGAR
jgi:hypothetical protein